MSNKNILITGGAGHLGFEITKNLLIDKNNSLIIIDKNIDRKKKIFFEKYSSRIKVIKTDISKKNSFKIIKKIIEKKYKVIDAIINNAAYYDKDKGFDVDFLGEKYEAWERVFKVNLFAPFFLTQHLYKNLIKSKNPIVINIGSIYGFIAPDFNMYKGTKMTNPASYNSSKGALGQLTKWMSSNLAPRIRTNIISPGGIFRGQNKTFLKRYNLKNPLKKMASEKDISNLVEFLISEKANYLNGQNIFVDGGFSNL